MAGIYDGTLSVLKASRLAAHLPPGSAILRGDDLDSRLWSGEMHLLAILIDMWAETRIDRPSDVAAQQARLAANQAKAVLRTRQAKRREGDG